MDNKDIFIIDFFGPWTGPKPFAFRITTSNIVVSNRNISLVNLSIEDTLYEGDENSLPCKIHSIKKIPEEYCPLNNIIYPVYILNNGEDEEGEISVDHQGYITISTDTNHGTFDPGNRSYGIRKTTISWSRIFT